MPDTVVVDEDMLADGGHWGVVLVDDAGIFGRGVRFNVILPKPLVTALDKEPARRAASRSALIAQGARALLARAQAPAVPPAGTRQAAVTARKRSKRK